ncbi:MAG: restriction endonuclease [Verrucomicrobiota bacterium JB022]|nr:restriction endonuclease [Verrucomicrobiota bacterium JB022]
MDNPYTTSAAYTPEEFEQHVQCLIQKSGVGLESFETTRREKLQGCDGEYEIDVVARFEALNTRFIVLIECKHHRNPIKREIVQILADRIRSCGAHKGMIFSTVRFQRGAVEYALRHGIALVKVTDAEPVYFNRSGDSTNEIPTRKGGWLVREGKANKVRYSAFDIWNVSLLMEAFNEEVADKAAVAIEFDEDY